MTMLISKFHRLIQSKLVWAVILIIIVFSFVIWGTQMPSKSDMAEANAPGELYGEPVDAKLFRQTYFNTYLTVIMAVGQPINITPQIDRQLRQAAWQRLIALRQAREMGLGASDDEVAAAIQSHEGFSTEGQFNKAIYKAFVQQFLAGLGFTERMFEEHVREEIVMQKARFVLDRATLVTPLELQRAFSSVSDRFKVEYVAITPDLVTNEVQVGRAEARAFFDKDPQLFTLPEKVRVRYVRFPDAAYTAQVEVTEEQMLDYYNGNLADFEIEDTNELAAAATNLLANTTRTRDFDEVKEEVRERLAQLAAREKASDAAMDFVVALTPDRDGKARTFEEAAAQIQAAVLEAGPFAARDEVEDIDAGAAFVRAAFELTEGDETYFSNPVDGEGGVYVLALAAREAARVPTFDEVEADVLPAAREQAVTEALARKASEIRDTVDRAIQTGQSFTEALVAFGLEPEPVLDFTASTPPSDVEDAEVLMRGVMLRNAGELTELLPTAEKIYLARLAERIPGDPSNYDTVKAQLLATIRRQYGRNLFDSWQDDLLKQANFKDRQTPADADEETVEEEDDAT